MFKKELERRQIDSVDDIKDDPAPTSPPSGQRRSTPPPGFAGGDDTPPQLLLSRQLNSEGLEGLIPRAAELVKLGLGFFLAFGPFIVAVALAFTAIYAVSSNYCTAPMAHRTYWQCTAPLPLEYMSHLLRPPFFRTHPCVGVWRRFCAPGPPQLQPPFLHRPPGASERTHSRPHDLNVNDVAVVLGGDLVKTAGR